MTHRIDQSNTSCFDCIYRYHYTITACSHTICISCLHAAIEEKIQLQLETFICPRCSNKEDSTQLNPQQSVVEPSSKARQRNKNKPESAQILHAQLHSVQHKHEPTQVNQLQQQEYIQTLELQLKRLTEENIHLINTGASTNVKIQVLGEQIKKLSIDNANLEKQAHRNELLAKEAQKEKEALIRYNEQLAQSLPNVEKDLKRIEEILHEQLNESQTSYLHEIDQYKRRIAQLETDNEQFEKEIYQLKQTIDLNQQKEHEYNDLQQQLTKEIEEYKKQIDHLQIQYQSQKNKFRQEIERLEQEKISEQHQYEESLYSKLAEKHIQIDALRTELDETKERNDSTFSQLDERLQSKRDGSQLLNNIQYFGQCLSSSRHIFESTIESSKQTLSTTVTTNKHDNNQRHIQTNNAILILMILMIQHTKSQLQSTANLVIGSTVVHHKHILWILNYPILTMRVDF
ncbi:unnamed protein product [Rotaria sp. Silwood1]|nr:unnamed protein product [Rotaria sp. Silwood1]CAF0991865.1 unnamed protein product [Rotaria sp. Silwood1]